jgi:hypothetical protein
MLTVPVDIGLFEASKDDILGSFAEFTQSITNLLFELCFISKLVEQIII